MPPGSLQMRTTAGDTHSQKIHALLDWQSQPTSNQIDKRSIAVLAQSLESRFTPFLTACSFHAMALCNLSPGQHRRGKRHAVGLGDGGAGDLATHYVNTADEGGIERTGFRQPA